MQSIVLLSALRRELAQLESDIDSFEKSASRTVAPSEMAMLKTRARTLRMHIRKIEDKPN